MEQTKIWGLYEAGQSFNHRMRPVDYYDQLEVNINYVEGNQWLGLEDNDEFPKAVFNYEKRFVDLFTSILCSAATGTAIEPYATINNEEQAILAKMAKASVDTFFDMTNYDAFRRYATRDMQIMGDIAAHYYFDPEAKTALGENGEIKREYVYGNNIMLGNPNTDIIDKANQPYVLVIGRDFVKNLKEEAKANGLPTDGIKPDEAKEKGEFETYEESDATGYQKATYVYKYEYKGDTIHVSKSVQNAPILKQTNTGLNRYPVAWLIWEKQYQNYHGRAMVNDVHYNQNYINRAFAMYMYYTMSVAYGKPIYNADIIDGWDNELGTAIGIEGLQPGQSVATAVTNWSPTQMSNQIVQCIELAIRYTKEALGVSDALLGNVDPDNRGAIVVATKNTQAPLENQKERIRQWTEEQVLILIDMMSNYYGQRKVLISDEEGSRMEDFNFDTLKNVPLNVNVEIGDASYFNEIGLQQTMDNLLNLGIVDAIQYLERMPDNMIPNKQDIINELKNKQPEGAEDDTEALKAKFESLPPEVQQQIMQLPQEQQADAVRNA